MNKQNIKQREFWSGKGGESWINDKDDMDRMLHTFGDHTANLINIKNGDDVIDIGCGTGKTTEHLSNIVGKTGSVLGVDISSSMIQYAEKIRKEKNIKNITYKEIDVQLDILPPLSFDHAFSRFGVMFFDNPKKAFENINNSLKKKATIGFVCWQTPEQNPWHSITQKVISSHFEIPQVTDIRAPSPFAFQQEEYIREILETANFSKVDVTPFNTKMIWFKGKTVEYAAQAMLERNPMIAQQLESQPSKNITKIINELADAYKTYYQGELMFPSSSWLVKAHKDN